MVTMTEMMNEIKKKAVEIGKARGVPMNDLGDIKVHIDFDAGCFDYKLSDLYIDVTECYGYDEQEQVELFCFIQPYSDAEKKH